MKLVIGVPQGSVLWPILFTLYTTPLEDIFAKYNLEFMFYTDDCQLYAVCNKPSDSVTVIGNCISEVREWMQSNQLVLNDNKREVVHFTSHHKKSIEHFKSLKISFQRNLFEILVFILRAQTTPVNISIEFVKLHILVCTELVKQISFESSQH